MYLLIGHDGDVCCQLVAAHLHARGHSVLTTAEPLNDENLFSWMLDTTHSRSRWQQHSGPPITDMEWEGVLVRASGVPPASGGWSAADLGYVRAETGAALIGWLHTLPCPVVNRPRADLWFHPQRSFLEWHLLFEQCALPVPAFLITNDGGAAREFAGRWEGRATYAPLTAAKRYPIAANEQWVELDKLMERLPVTLMEPCDGPLCYATLAGEELFWSADPQLSGAELTAFVTRLFTLASTLGLDFVQVEFSVEADGLRCLRVLLYPLFDRHSPADQEAIAVALAGLLNGGSR